MKGCSMSKVVLVDSSVDGARLLDSSLCVEDSMFKMEIPQLDVEFWVPMSDIITLFENVIEKVIREAKGDDSGS